MPARLAFKATDGKGNPAKVSGTLFEDGHPLATFTSLHQGMGTIDFIPRTGKEYHVGLTGGERHPLPQIYPEGATLSLSERGKDHLLFTIRQKGGRQPRPFYLAGRQRGAVCSLAKGILRDSITVKIPLDDFMGQGIAQFTLFTHDLKPVSERLVYLMPEKRLHISLTTEKEIYYTREKAEVVIRVTDENGDPVRAHLGASVFDEAFHDPADPANILAYFHLTSQLRGRVYNPAYYFDGENQGRHVALDLLMLTQGWSRYVWDMETFVPCGETVIADGIPGRQVFKSERKSKLVSSGEQLVQVFGAGGDARFTWTDSAGYFTVEPEMLKELRGGYIYLKPMLGEEFTPQILTVGFFQVIDSLRKMKSHNYPLSSNMQQLERESADNLPVMSSDSIILLGEFTVT